MDSKYEAFMGLPFRYSGPCVVDGVSWYQEDLANRLAVFERRLRFGRLRQRVLAADVDLQPTTTHPVKNVTRAFLKLLARRRVRAEIHSGEVEAALVAE